MHNINGIIPLENTAKLASPQWLSAIAPAFPRTPRTSPLPINGASYRSRRIKKPETRPRQTARIRRSQPLNRGARASSSPMTDRSDLARAAQEASRGLKIARRVAARQRRVRMIIDDVPLTPVGPTLSLAPSRPPLARAPRRRAYVCGRASIGRAPLLPPRRRRLPSRPIRACARARG